MSTCIFRKLSGGNMDIDLILSSKKSREQNRVLGTEEDKTSRHKCAIKNKALCKHFKGIQIPNIILCAYREKQKSAAGVDECQQFSLLTGSEYSFSVLI